MNTQSGHQAATLRALHVQIQEMCRRFKKIRSEASGIVESNQMPDVVLHLNDVLKATEDSTMVILETATAISGAVEASEAPVELKSEIGGYVGKIYESCSFQDISGQRIRNVLDHLNELEEQLLRLADISKGQTSGAKVKNSLLNGPQLSSIAPSQTEVDELFNDVK